MTKRAALPMLFSLFFLLIFSQPLSAAPEALADLAEDFIPVTEDFDGAHMMVFGALTSAKSDIVVVFEGPPAKALIRAKVKKLGIWVNDEPQLIEPVPSFYAVLSSRPLTDMMKPEALTLRGLGLNSLPLDSVAGQGLLKNRLAKGLYLEMPDGVKIRDKKLFRADINLPPNVPVGAYKATIYEIKNGVITASRVTTFKIAPIGLASMIRNLSVRQPALYAALAIALVLLIGGFAATLFRKAT
ncbi:MAG: TIGR02186 family protein [Bdellovibrionales bacterium]|jgi:uncharacterized protein (TIGR02186 family)